MLYISRKIGWTFAFIFFVLMLGMYFWPNMTRPFVGYIVLVGDATFKSVLDIVQYVLS